MDRYNPLKTIGRNLKKLRAEKSLTQRELAEQTGISPGTIAYLELGNHNIGILALTKLASYFKVSTDSLLGLDYPLSDTILYQLRSADEFYDAVKKAIETYEYKR